MKSLLGIVAVALGLLMPLVVAGAGVTNHNFVRWEKEIAAFEQNDATNPPVKGAILFAGSSTIRLWRSLAQDFPGQTIINRGFGGSQIADSTHFAERVIIPCQPRMIFFRAGGNDLKAGKPVEQVFADFKEFAETIHARLPQTQIAYISWSPTPARWNQHEQEKTLNTLVAGYIAGKPYLKYIEAYDLPLGADGLPRAELFVADKIHFNAEGYKLLAERVRPFLPR